MPGPLLLVIVGLELMAAPAFLHASEPVADSFRTAGPVVAAVGFLSAFTITRGLRRLELAPGAWLLVAPLVLTHSTAATINSLAAGAVVVALALVPHHGESSRDRYGGGWVALWRPERLPADAGADTRK